LVGETNDTNLFFGIEPFDLLNDLIGSHLAKYGDTPQSSSPRCKVTRSSSGDLLTICDRAVATVYSP
jgi:hypothetical protein